MTELPAWLRAEQGEPGQRDPRPSRARIDADPEDVAKGLVQLVLTLVELDERMAELRDYFGLTEEDLNLDLGPLGRLL